MTARIKADSADGYGNGAAGRVSATPIRPATYPLREVGTRSFLPQ